MGDGSLCMPAGDYVRFFSVDLETPLSEDEAGPQALDLGLNKMEKVRVSKYLLMPVSRLWYNVASSLKLLGFDFPRMMVWVQCGQFSQAPGASPE